MQGAKAAAAVGLERAHTELLGQGEGLPIVGLGQLGLRRIMPRRNLTEKAESIRLVTALLVVMGMRSHTLGEGVCLLCAAREQMRLSQRETTEYLLIDHFLYTGLFHSLCE